MRLTGRQVRELLLCESQFYILSLSDVREFRLFFFLLDFFRHWLGNFGSAIGHGARRINLFDLFVIAEDGFLQRRVEIGDLAGFNVLLENF